MDPDDWGVADVVFLEDRVDDCVTYVTQRPTKLRRGIWVVWEDTNLTHDQIIHYIARLQMLRISLHALLGQDHV